MYGSSSIVILGLLKTSSFFELYEQYLKRIVFIGFSRDLSSRPSARIVLSDLVV